MAKLTAAVAVFLLVLVTAAFASPADPQGFDSGVDGGVAEVERADLIAEHEQEEEEFILYLGPQEQEQDEITDDVDDRRVN